MYNIGDIVTSKNSGVTGEVIEIITCKNGALRLALRTEAGTIKWTTVHI